MQLHDRHRAGISLVSELEDLKKKWNGLPSAAAKNVFVEERVARVAQIRQVIMSFDWKRLSFTELSVRSSLSGMGRKKGRIKVE